MGVNDNHDKAKRSSRHEGRTGRVELAVIGAKLETVSAAAAETVRASYST